MKQKLMGLQRASLEHISLNIGYACNQHCYHCHLEAGPDREEMIDVRTVERLVPFLKKVQPVSLEITGGAPELCPHLSDIIVKTRPLVKKMSLRTNLTILDDAPYFSLIKTFIENKVELIASLPCYRPETVDRQRGPHVFDKSIRILKKLNGQGYGSEIDLSIAYNPNGPVLAGCQAAIEKDFRQKLGKEYGISFSRLLVLTNFPVGRFASLLKQDKKYDAYITLLQENFNPCVLDRLMCLRQVTVNWKGDLYDCDFNMALDLPKGGISSLDTYEKDRIIGRKIEVGDHCFACTAGQGASCHGVLET